ncbi:MAG: hypothetical protein IJ565_02640 [Bacilli bacterium]|nr:hypothetical protein [Bacilli bacterium]
MNEKKGILNQYNEEETRQLLNDKVKMVYIDNGVEEVVARYEDLPDIIVDVNEKLGHNQYLKVYDFENPNFDKPLLTTTGYFLDNCDPDVRKDIIDKLIQLQMGEIEVRDYKVINEDMLDDIRVAMEQEEMEK